MKKRDLIIIGAVLAAAALSAVLSFLLRGTGSGTDTVRVYLHNELYGAYPLSAPRTVRVDQPDGSWNEIEITGEAVYMADANCKNQDCVHMGALTPGGGIENQRWIICLPHGLSVELAGP